MTDSDNVDQIFDEPCGLVLDRRWRSLVYLAGEHGSWLHLCGLGGDELLSAAPAHLHDMVFRTPRTALRNLRGHAALDRWRYAAALRQLLDRRSYRDWLARFAAGPTDPPVSARFPVLECIGHGAARAGCSARRKSLGAHTIVPVRDDTEMAMLVADEVAKIHSVKLVESLQGYLVRPRVCMLDWDYGDRHPEFREPRYPGYIVAEFPESGTGIAYSEHGFGPTYPWGLIWLERPGFGMDSGWFATLEAAFRDSMAWSEPPPPGYEVD
ncbi:asparagine synthase [Nocardia tenerifensis]|uniref:Asparagine synthase n=1 Tax=Nocardia tenerifensis TaxID=228006 RepID=A0A318JUZ9_9NOCA|nr:asparagine synthase [Nocardia tenerifensis]